MNNEIQVATLLPPPEGLDYRTAYGRRTPECNNVIIKDGELRRAPVMAAFGATMDDRICFLYEWRRIDGSRTLIAATKTSLYYCNSRISCS